MRLGWRGRRIKSFVAWRKVREEGGKKRGRRKMWRRNGRGRDNRKKSELGVTEEEGERKTRWRGRNITEEGCCWAEEGLMGLAWRERTVRMRCCLKGRKEGRKKRFTGRKKSIRRGRRERVVIDAKG